MHNFTAVPTNQGRSPHQSVDNRGVALALAGRYHWRWQLDSGSGGSGTSLECRWQWDSGSGPWTPVEGRLEWGSPVDECEREGVFCKDVEEHEGELA